MAQTMLVVVPAKDGETTTFWNPFAESICSSDLMIHSTVLFGTAVQAP